MIFTPAQTRAIAADGNVLVMAGAGTGKTRTLVERAVQRLLDPRAPVSLDDILIVTFTEAAAAEIRARIRARLEEELTRRPGETRLREQIALLDTAHISTLHSFCLHLVREHFYELGLDPQLAVLSEEQAQLLAGETLDTLFTAHYAGTTPENLAVQELIQSYARGWDVPIRDLLLQLHESTQTQPDPDGWFDRELNRLARSEPSHWKTWWLEGVEGWRTRWLPVLRAEPVENTPARRGAELLRDALDSPTHAAEVLAAALATDNDWPAKKKTAFRKPIEKFFDEAAFLHSLVASSGSIDPLTEDWQWVRAPMATLLRLAREFAAKFTAAKRESGSLDFHDLEQFALRLLWDTTSRQPTALARQWRERFQLMFVDEYQDINAAQDAILTALSREGAAANRFLVGDVKQSIYRFRQAEPRIFQDYAARWRGVAGGGQVIDLQENFRSHASVLDFANALFAALMRREIGGVDFDDAARLRFGDPDGRAPMCTPEVRVEVNLRLKEKSADDDTAPSLAESSDADQEALLVARRLIALRVLGHEVWDDALKSRRPIEWADMVILLRSPRSKVESYAKVFARAGIPLDAKRGGFFDSIEVRDLLNVLRLLDNPLQDIPAIAVLRSPLAGLTLDELATVRLTLRPGKFWTALLRFREVQMANGKWQSVEAAASTDSLARKVETFLARFERWRVAGRHASLSQRLEMILNDTGYGDWLLTQPRGEQRQANVQELLHRTRQFDELHGQGLSHFFNRLEAQEAADVDSEPSPHDTTQAVRLMSIHQSKGLEFPVVVVADLGKRFNLADGPRGVILDEHYGLCPMVKPPDTGQRYPSLPYWLAQQRRRGAALGEELRVLYVALTRAQDTLLLVGTCGAKTAEATWAEKSQACPPSHQLLQANTFLDWLGPWLTQTAGVPDWAQQPKGATALWRWRIWNDAASNAELPASAPPATDSEQRPDADIESIRALRTRLDWEYPWHAATTVPAKTSVTALRRRWSDATDLEAAPAPYVVSESLARTQRTSEKRDSHRHLTAEEIGQAHHRFLQWVELLRTGSRAELDAEAQRLGQEKLLSSAEVASLDLAALAGFWTSELGQCLRARADAVRREWPFTARLTREEIDGRALASVLPAGEFVVVQGVVDLAVVAPEEIWIVDFKTDAVTPRALDEKVQRYRPQIELYAVALSRIHRRPVTQRWLHFLMAGHTVKV